MEVRSDRKRRLQSQRGRTESEAEKRTRDPGHETETVGERGRHTQRPAKLDQRLSTPSRTGTTHCQALARARAPGGLPGSVSGSWSEPPAPAGHAHSSGAPAARPGPEAGVRPARARSAGGALFPPSLPPFLPLSLPPGSPCYKQRWDPHLVAQRGVRSLAQQQLQAAATAPGSGHVQRRQRLGRSGAGEEEGSVEEGTRSPPPPSDPPPGALALSPPSPPSSLGHHTWNLDPAPLGQDPNLCSLTLERLPPDLNL